MEYYRSRKELRKWFNHEDEKWEEFVRRYYLELTGNKQGHKEGDGIP